VPFDPALSIAADRGEAFVAKAPWRESVRALKRIADGIRAALPPRRA